MVTNRTHALHKTKGLEQLRGQKGDICPTVAALCPSGQDEHCVSADMHEKKVLLYMFEVDFLKSSPVPKWWMIIKNQDSNSNPQRVHWIKDDHTTVKYSENETLSLKIFHLTYIAQPWLCTGQSRLLLCIVTPHRSILSQEKTMGSQTPRPQQHKQML